MYDYKEQKPFIFTEDGQRMFLKVRDKCNLLHQTSGAFTAHKAIEGLSGDSWHMIACVDRLVELGEFEYTLTNAAWQDRILRKVEYRGH
jgi:hypothetical protein